MPARNEALARQSDITRFIYEEELAKIPRDILADKSAEGTRKHDLIYREHDKPTNSLIVQMFQEGLKRIFTPQELKSKPRVEKQLNGPRFTGKPDYGINQSVVDYKFTLDLKPHVALQLILYGILIGEVDDILVRRFFAFHYPTDHGLFIYKVPDRTVEPLREFAQYIIENHEAIKDGKVERYEALSQWDKLNEDYEMFEPVATIFPPLTITNEAEAEKAARFYCRLKEVIDYEKYLKGELKRYLSEKGESFVKDDEGFGVRLQKGSPTIFYDKVKKAAVMASHKKNLAGCETDRKDNFSLVRFKPSAKKPKQIN